MVPADGTARSPDPLSPCHHAVCCEAPRRNLGSTRHPQTEVGPRTRVSGKRMFTSRTLLRPSRRVLKPVTRATSVPEESRLQRRDGHSREGWGTVPHGISRTPLGPCDAGGGLPHPGSALTGQLLCSHVGPR